MVGALVGIALVHLAVGLLQGVAGWRVFGYRMSATPKEIK